MVSRRQFLTAAGAAAGGGCLSDVPLDSGPRPCETGDVGAVEGAWPTLGGGAGRAGRTRDVGPGADAEPEWCASVGAGEQWTSYPVVADGFVYVCGGKEEGRESRRDGLYALDAATGEERWRARTAGRAVETPTIEGGTVVLGLETREGRGVVQGFDARAGEERWRTDVGARTGGAPTAAEEAVFVTDRNATVRAFAVEDGTRRWERRFGDESTAETGGTESNETEAEVPDFAANFGWPATASGDRVYVASTAAFGGGTPSLYALDADSGETRWEEFVFLDGTVAAADGAVFGSGFGKQLAALSADGNARWTAETDWLHATPPAFDGETVYVGGERLAAFDPADGSERWVVETGGETGAQPAAADDAVYAFDGNGRLAVVDADGTVRGRISGPIGVPFAVASGTLFALTGLRRLEAFVATR